ncbi:PspC domain-containing protein [Corynebacterium flavescens]
MTRQGPREESPYSGPASPREADFSGTLHAMWNSRPPRLPSAQGGKAHIAGVCEGIAVRYQLDPTIVRVAFVVSTIAFGGGIAAYVAAWAIMPRYGKKTSPLEEAFGRHDGEASEAGLGWGLIIAFGIAMGIGPLIGGATPSSLLVLSLFGLAWYLLHRREPVPPAGLSATEQPTRHEAVDLSAFTPVEGYPFPPGRKAPPSWDPLGVVPEAWDLPDPSPRPQPRKRGRGLAIAAGWILAIAAALGLLAYLSYDSGESSYSSTVSVGIGELEQTPRSEEDLPEHYDLGIGSATIDFSQLPGLSAPRDVTVEMGIGELNVTLPESIPFNLTCDSGVGQSNCTPRSDPEAKLNIHIDHGVGSVKVNG